jgi:hypothetical protein
MRKRRFRNSAVDFAVAKATMTKNANISGNAKLSDGDILE